jgi:hypothetical protein
LNANYKWVGAGLFCLMVAVTGCGTPAAAGPNSTTQATSVQQNENGTASTGNQSQGGAGTTGNESSSGVGTEQAATSYTNDRYGFSVRVPANFEQAPPAEDGDGQTWYTEGNAVEIQTFGEFNVSQNTVQSELAALLSTMQPTYHQSSKDWLVVTGYSGLNIVYDKVYVGKTNLYELQIKYPKSEQEKYGSVVDNVSASFHPGSMS